MSNIHGLGSSKSKASKPDESEEFFGGGATSGTAVWRPTQGPMRQPQPGQPAPNSNSPPPSAMHALAAAARAQAASDDQEGMDRNIGLITIYANGFILGNSEFRDAADPRNAAFIESLKAGQVPEELDEMCRREWGDDADAVRVTLVDKASETYKPKFSFAASKGQSLGSSSSTSASTTASYSSIPASRVTIDSSQPTTVLQLVLADRRRVRETFNVTNTVAEVYGHIAALSSNSPGSFEIVAGFPPKPLTQLDQTLKDAGLVGSSIQQKPV